MTSAFEIKSINVFSSWVFNLPKNNDCTICRCNLNVPSLYNQEKGTDSYVVSGICQHSFHYECIKPWTDKNKHCPICAQLWQYEQIPNDYNNTDTNKKINILNEINNKMNIDEINKKNMDKMTTINKYIDKMNASNNYGKYINKM
jgi:hypothetical protein